MCAKCEFSSLWLPSQTAFEVRVGAVQDMDCGWLPQRRCNGALQRCTQCKLLFYRHQKSNNTGANIHWLFNCSCWRYCVRAFAVVVIFMPFYGYAYAFAPAPMQTHVYDEDGTSLKLIWGVGVTFIHIRTHIHTYRLLTFITVPVYRFLLMRDQIWNCCLGSLLS